MTFLGLLAGVVLGLRQPPAYEARSGVLLPPSAVDSSGKPLRNIATELRVAASAAVLGEAGKALEPPLGVRSLQRRVHVKALSPDIIQITAEAKSGRGAARVADAVAKAYVDYAGGAAAAEADVETSSLRDQAADLNKQLVQLQNDITAARAKLGSLDPRSSDAARQSALLDSLLVSQVETSREVSTLNARIAEVNLNAKLARSGIRVLEPAIPPRAPTRRRLATALGVTLFTGMVVGVVLALARDRGDPRLRTRDAIAEAAGAPVLLSLAVSHPVRDKQCRAAYARWQPNSVQRYAFTQALARLGLPGQSPSNVVIAATPGDKSACLFALHLALFLESAGTPTGLMLMSSEPASSLIRGACATEARRRPNLHPGLEVYELGQSEDAAPLRLPVLVTLVTDPNAALSQPVSGRTTVPLLAVSAGYATSEQLASAALRCFDASFPLQGVCVVNPDPADTTTGWFPSHARDAFAEPRSVRAGPATEISSGPDSQPTPSMQGLEPTAPVPNGRTKSTKRATGKRATVSGVENGGDVADEQASAMNGAPRRARRTRRVEAVPAATPPEGEGHG